ncbi:MAG: LacI family DNA-binding transcriptional regulator [Chloroflexota bacterium]
MTTTKDVARRAGVSVATVSAVINGNKFVSDELAQRVKAAIAELGYRPNLLARGLKSGRSRTIGVIIPNIRDPYWSEIVAAVEGAARADGYSILLCDSQENPSVERRSLDLLAESKVDGIIVVPTGVENEPRIASLVDEGISVVLVSRRLPTLDLDAVITDYEMAGYLAAHHLIETGYRRVAIIVYPPFASSGADKLRGYQRAMTEAASPLDPTLIRESQFPPEESGFREMEKLLQHPEGRPDAVVACTHLLVMGILRSLRDHHLAVPDDLGLVAFDDYPWTPYMRPALTVVQQQRSQMGVVAARRLIARISGDLREPGRTISVSSELIVRESCGACRKDSGTNAESAGQGVGLKMGPA